MQRTEDIAQLVRNANWYHSFEVLPGVVTPGRHVTNARDVFDQRYALPADLSGKAALDIGALDGPYSFELERRGARVTAIDIQDPNRTGFNTAKRVRNSAVRYVQGSVYELFELLNEEFDIVTFFGVWYHLKNPVAAFEQLRLALKPDGLLLFEGECLRSYAERASGQPDTEHQDCLRVLGDSDVPLSLFYSGKYKGDPWSWFVPNAACVHEWLKTAGLELASHGFWDEYPHQRMYGSARKRLEGEIAVDNPVW